jgi:tetratricopeptide (TPR) repeat protein
MIPFRSWPIRPLLVASIPLSLAALLCPSAPADTVVLVNGNRIQGEIVDEGPQGVTVRFPGGTLKVRSRDIAGIERESRLQVLLGEGDSSLRRGDPEAAADAYRRALADTPGSEAARTGLLDSQERIAGDLAAAGSHREGIEAYRKLLEVEPEHPRARAAIVKIEAEIRQGEADEAEGLRALRRGESETAVERLRRVHDRFRDRSRAVAPSLAAALIREGDRLLAGGKPDEAEARYLEAASLDPDQAPAMSKGFAAARAVRIAPFAGRGEFKRLLEEAEEGLRIAPGSDVIAYLAALAQEGLGLRKEAAEGYIRVSRVERPRDPVKALDSLRRAAEARLAPPGTKESGGEDRARDEVLAGDYREIETEHFVLRHRNAAVGTEAAEAAEAAYGRIRGALDLEEHWRKRCTITIHSTRAEFREATGQDAWTGGSHRIVRKMGVFSDHRIDSWQGQPRLASAVIPHEIAHALLEFATGYGNTLPLWLNEGFAIHFEPPYIHRWYRQIAAGAAHARILPKASRIAAATEYPPGDETARIFYAASFTLADILFDDRTPADVALLARGIAADPAALDGLLQKVFRIRGLKALENRWMANIRL